MAQHELLGAAVQLWTDGEHAFTTTVSNLHDAERIVQAEFGFDLNEECNFCLSSL